MTVLVVCGAARAQTESSGMVWLGLGAGHSDNVRRTVTRPDAGSFTALAVESDLDFESARLALEFVADFERRQYSIAGVEDETYGNGQLSFTIEALPDRVAWLVVDNYSQGRIDPFQVSSPLNRAGINVFLTGPQFNLPLGLRSLFRLTALKGDRHTSDIPSLDSESREAAAAYVRVVDNTTEFAVNFSTQEVEYDANGGDVDTKSAYLSYSKTLATGDAYVAIGSTRSESTSRSSSTPYMNLSWSRAIGARSRFAINAVQQYVDFFDDFRLGSSSETVLGRDVYEQQLLAAVYAIEGSRNAFELRHSTAKASYTTDPILDYDESLFGVTFRRSLTPRMSIDVSFTASQREFDREVRTDEISRWQLSLEKDLGRRFSLRALYESRDDDNVLGEKVEDNVVRVFLRYAVTRAASS